MNTFNIDGKKWMKKTILKIYLIYLYLMVILNIFMNIFVDFTQAVINLTNSDLINSELKVAFERASNDNQFISVNVED